jgi:large subunit ribosomal protein L25
MRYKKMVASLREERGTRSCRSLRHSGQLPGVIYGGQDGEGKPNREVQSIVIDRKELESTVHDGIKFVDIDLGGNEIHTVIKELQWDAFDDHILHIDLERIDLTKPVVVNVPVLFKGVAKGEKVGGRVKKFVEDLSVRGLPREIPESLTLRIDDVDANENLKVSDMEVPEGIEIVTPAERVILECKVKRVAVEVPEEEVVAAEGAES